MIQLLGILLLAIVPMRDGTLRESCDLIELNHFFDEYGRLVFDQIIFYAWEATTRDSGRFQVIAWRLCKSEGQVPQYDHARNRYVSQWQDDKHYRVVESKAARESWTQYDVELIERDIVPKERRKELRTK